MVPINFRIAHIAEAWPPLNDAVEAGSSGEISDKLLLMFVSNGVTFFLTNHVEQTSHRSSSVTVGPLAGSGGQEHRGRRRSAADRSSRDSASLNSFPEKVGIAQAGVMTSAVMAIQFDRNFSALFFSPPQW